MPGFSFPLQFPLDAPAQLLAVQASGTLTPTIVMVRARTLALSAAATMTAVLNPTTYFETVYGLGIVLEDASGVRHALLGNLALDGQGLALQRPTLQLPGRVGALAVGPRLAVTRRLTLSGVFENITPDAVENLARVYRGYMLGKAPVKLFRRETDNRYVVVRAARVSDDPNRGRHGGKVVTLTFELEAADPFWYAATPEVVTRSVSAAYDRWALSNPAGIPQVQAVVTFTARAAGVINPSLHNGQGGFLAAYTGTLNAGESVVLNGPEGTATKNPGGLNVLAAVNAAWRADGFPLSPGTNEVTYQDDAASSHAVDVTVEWTPVWI